MIRIAIIVFVSLALNIGTYFAADLTDRQFLECDICAIEGQDIAERGFPIAYAEEANLEIETAQEGIAETERLFASFSLIAFLANWLIWAGVVALLYFVAFEILKHLGMMALLVYLGLTALGYTVSVGTWF